MSEKEVKFHARILYKRMKGTLEQALTLYSRKHIAAVIREVATLIEKPRKKKVKKHVKNR